MASTGWRRRVLEHLYDSRAAVTVEDLARLLDAPTHLVQQLLLGLEEDWLAARQVRFHHPGGSPQVTLTADGRSYVERAYRAVSEPEPCVTDGT